LSVLLKIKALFDEVYLSTRVEKNLKDLKTSTTLIVKRRIFAQGQGGAWRHLDM